MKLMSQICRKCKQIFALKMSSKFRRLISNSKNLSSNFNHCANCNQRFSPTCKPVKKFLGAGPSPTDGARATEVWIWEGVLEILNWDIGNTSSQNPEELENEDPQHQRLLGTDSIDKSLALCQVCAIVVAKLYLAIRFFKNIQNAEGYLGKYIEKYWKSKGKGMVSENEDNFGRGDRKLQMEENDHDHMMIDIGNEGDEDDDMDYEESLGKRTSRTSPRKRVPKDPAPDYELFKEAPPAAAQKTETRLRPFLCYHCGSGFDKHTNLKRHLLLSHGEGDRDKVFMCDDCGKCYYFAYLLKNHQKVHSEDRPFPCDEEGCNLRFKTKLSVSHHKDAVHRKIKRYACTFCGKEFRVRRDWRWHEEFVHRAPKGKKFFVCEFGCGCSYRRKHSVQHHQRRCSLNPNPGGLAPEESEIEQDISIGKAEEESGNEAEAIEALVGIQRTITLYPCSKGCGKAFATAPELESHDQYYCPKLFVTTSSSSSRRRNELQDPDEGTTLLIVEESGPDGLRDEDAESGADEENYENQVQVDDSNPENQEIVHDPQFHVEVSTEEVVEVEYYTI